LTLSWNWTILYIHDEFSEAPKKQFSPFFALFRAFFFFISCAKPELTVWSAYPELAELFEEAGKSYKKLTIKYTQPETADFASVDASLKPGLFVLPGDALPAFVDAGGALDISGMLPQGLPVYYRGERPYGLFLDSGTGAFCYDPELMERYLYFSGPSTVQKQFGDLNSFIVAAFLVGERSFGSCAILPSVEELRPSFLSSESLSLLRAGLNVTQAERWFKDIEEIFKDRRWEGLTLEDGSPRRTLAFFLPAHSPFTVPEGSPAETSWQVIRGPDPQSNGGVWLVLHRDLFSGKKREVERIQGYLKTLLQNLEKEPDPEKKPEAQQ